MSTAKGTWNLTEIFHSPTDPAIDKAIQDAEAQAEHLEGWKGKIKCARPEDLLRYLKDFEGFEAKISDVVLFANLSFSANMTSTENQLLHDKVEKLEARLAKRLAFFPLELGELIKFNPCVIVDPVLSGYRHMLERVQRRVPHQLSEVEEQLIIEKDLFGVNAWEELQSKWLNTRTFLVTVEGAPKALSYGEANGLLAHTDRATRKSANQSIYSGLAKDGEIFASALRNICNDWVMVSERRKYYSPMESSFISNDTEQATINNLLHTVEEHSSLYRQYLQLKAQLMGLPKLGCHDIIAPLPNVPKTSFSFEKAQAAVTNAYWKFDEDYASAVEDMFARNHIDVYPRFGKRNGAFCAGWLNGKSAFILHNFSSTLNDVYTLAHEMGHATHDYYAQRSQSPFNLNIPSVVAETASIFGELLLTDSLLSSAESDEMRKAILCLVLDEAGMTSFQVTARVWFEQALYESIKRSEFLDYSAICGHWVTARNRIYGNSVDWFPELEAEWAMKPHYYMANYRFYNYPYVYAQLFVYSLYEQYLKETKEFVPKLKKALSAGSSLSPVEIGDVFGLDVKTPEFWELGMRRFRGFFEDLQKIS